MIHLKIALKLGLLTLCWALSGIPIAGSSAVVTNEAIKCAYDPARGKPNPLGNRAFITVVQRGNDTHFRYIKFPIVVTKPAELRTKTNRAVTVENQRALVFYDTPIEVARSAVRQHNEYYYELVGYVDLAGFAAYDEVMSCE